MNRILRFQEVNTNGPVLQWFMYFLCHQNCKDSLVRGYSFSDEEEPQPTFNIWNSCLMVVGFCMGMYYDSLEHLLGHVF